ncbi:hypothetical protein OHU11_17250 [Streptomyces sp. NBC_00257]|uniref:hypothetical protein n=1 Tax=unclassified Streptomyces TaxID=2593676 RepID=UPI002253544A|nr:MULTISPECIES: hypothetical protein [unclassified Streptomyces]WTB56392.1 hypothetical protein OG832_26165 [Streptomyces sp. NBC_00826]WTH90724.1 hypothetical protein OIC43_17530 [Streptomyces sp. NBC_00825]WTH99450.1 hypothetical protein OHA23_17515 [Streptomyces sp. NBC_00822]MCX4864891.1 hypothetical protein [Streptomyces sp. NBC_00906]MCX4896129.1 hypothetical protein [Streptomyces sp. NBC_00892]
MFFTYLRRELRRRRKAALVVASGLALGIALVIVVSSVSTGRPRPTRRSPWPTPRTPRRRSSAA